MAQGNIARFRSHTKRERNERTLTPMSNVAQLAASFGACPSIGANAGLAGPIRPIHNCAGAPVAQFDPYAVCRLGAKPFEPVGRKLFKIA
jgi:hypothetical protein